MSSIYATNKARNLFDRFDYLKEMYMRAYGRFKRDEEGNAVDVAIVDTGASTVAAGIMLTNKQTKNYFL